VLKNKEISPKGQSKPPYKPKYRKKHTADEEKALRHAGAEIDAYLSFGLEQKSGQPIHCTIWAMPFWANSANAREKKSFFVSARGSVENFSRIYRYI
jgi:hypothetical protein